MKIFLIMPSRTMSKGLESILSETGDFTVEGSLTDLSRQGELLFKNFKADTVIVDPILFSHSSRSGVKQYFARFTDAAVVAYPSYPIENDSLEQYDAVLNLYDSPSVIVKKLREAILPSAGRASDTKTDAKELTSREKDILVCVAKGMLNKEIADKFNISIHTVITHRKNITGKTGIKSIAGLTVYAMLNNLISPSAVE